MNAPTPWTVVSHAADESSPAISIVDLLKWLDAEPSVSLHSVLWGAGPGDPSEFDHGRFHDVRPAHQSPSARALRSVGFTRLAGGLAGNAVRRVLREVPTDGVLYLNTAHSGAVLRYLPTGGRTVVTHLHAIDRQADPALAVDKVERLVEATQVWLASDEETRIWAADAWGIDPGSVSVVPEPIDLSTLPGLDRPTDPNRLRLGISGATWFGRDLSARVVQTLLRIQPALDLEIVWGSVVERAHIVPLLHDMERLSVLDHLELPRSIEELQRKLGDVDVVVLTTPDSAVQGPIWQVATAGVPTVCFDTHRRADEVSSRTGQVVPYLDIPAMAEAVLASHREQRESVGAEVAKRRAELAHRDVAVIGPQVMDLARAGARR